MTLAGGNIEASPEHIVARHEMTITPAEFRRLARHLPGAEAACIEPLSISSTDELGRVWKITLSNLRSRVIGLVRLPVADLEIEMRGYSSSEVERFLDRFYLVFRKGGG